MANIGIHASHEQFTPRELLDVVAAAEAAGFAAAMSSDHFMPWSDAQGQSGHAWSWLGAALERTSLPVGVVSVAGYRYHVAVVAQAAATLAQMYPGRFWLALGSGERLNEHITGERWPGAGERDARLRECVDVVRALWRGECVDHRGHVVVEDAKLYTLPPVAPPLFGAAITPETAEKVGGWADGLLTVNRPHHELRKVVDAFRRGGGEGKPMYLQVHVSYHEDEHKARRLAHAQWKTMVFESDVLAELKLPAQFEAAAKTVREDDLDASVRISSSLERHVEWLAQDVALGFSHVFVHNVNREQRRFVDAFGAQVVPAFARN
jgi:coenzyme F420-dependent glucose-6-phosphate dehydrogenase